MRKLFLFFLVVSLTPTVFAQTITFKNHGKVVKTLSVSELQKLFTVHTLKVHDPSEESDITYKAMAVVDVFNQIYGSDWVREEEVLFTCLDGYQPSIPVELFTQSEGLFATERVGASSFTIVNKSENNKKVNVGPLYLIWNKTSDGKMWPYQLAGVDLTTFAEQFPRLAPPKNSGSSVRKGFSAFRKNCMVCHTINGDGGNIGPELNYPVNVTEYYKESFLRKWIDNPTSIRFKTPMPGLHKDVKNRTETIENIISYLKSMKNQKTKPKGL